MKKCFSSNHFLIKNVLKVKDAADTDGDTGADNVKGKLLFAVELHLPACRIGVGKWSPDWITGPLLPVLIHRTLYRSVHRRHLEQSQYGQSI